MPALRTRSAIVVVATTSPDIAAPLAAAPPDGTSDRAAAKKLKQRRKDLDKRIKKLQKAWKKDKSLGNGLSLASAYAERAQIAAKTTKADKLRTKALAVYAALAKDATNERDGRYDEFLFSYGYLLQQANRPKEARKLFHALIKNHPNSKHVPNAYLAFADFFFDSAAMENALSFYDKVLQFPNTEVYTYALYKKGWVYMNIGQPQDALESFFKVTTKTKGSTVATDQALFDSAKKDFVLAYADVGKATKAYQAFKRVDKAAAFDMLGRLADIYDSQGQWEKVVYVRRDQIKTKPKHDHVCRFQLHVVEALTNIGKPPETVKAVSNLGKLYKTYANGSVLPADELAYCGARSEQLLAHIGTTLHREAQKTLNADSLRHAVAIYDAYIDAFPTATDAERLAFYRADLQWRLATTEDAPRQAEQAWHDAAKAFATYVMAPSAHERTDAISGALLAYANAIAIADAAGTSPATLRKEAAAVGSGVVSNQPGHPDADVAKTLVGSSP
jgi:tetratricopeptide (TPR) repeat protein